MVLLLGLFWKRRTCLIVKTYRIDLYVWVLSERENFILYWNKYHISSVIRLSCFPSKTIYNGSRSFGLFRKGRVKLVAKLHRTDLVVCRHLRERKTLSYS